MLVAADLLLGKTSHPSLAICGPLAVQIVSRDVWLPCAAWRVSLAHRDCPTLHR